MLMKLAFGACVAMGLALPSGVHAYMVGVACSAGEVSGPDALGNNLICSGGVFAIAGAGSATPDRIVSGTDSIIVNGATDTISVTIAGSAVANFGAGGLGITAINASGNLNVSGNTSLTAVSATVGAFSGNLSVSGSIISGDGVGSGYYQRLDNSGLIVVAPAGGDPAVRLIQQNIMDWAIYNAANTGVLTFGYNGQMGLTPSGRLGIGTTAPAATLQVSGSFIVSITGQNTTPTLWAGTNGRIGLGTAAPTQRLHIVGTTSADTDDIIVGGDNGSYQLRMGYRFTTGVGVVQGWGTGASNIYSRLALNPDGGNVGVGTTTPAATLQVSGTTLLENTLANVSTNALTIANYANSATPGVQLNFGILTASPAYQATIGHEYAHGYFNFYIGSPGSDGFQRRYGVAQNYLDGTYHYWNKTGGTEAMRLANNGNFGIGTTNPAARLDVVSATAGVAVARFQNGTGACTFTPDSSGSGAWSCSSDARLKKDITDAQSVLTWLDSFRIRDFTMKADGSRQTGVIAQEVKKVHPEMVKQGADGMYMVEAPGLWKLVKVMQELRTENAGLRVVVEGQRQTFDEQARMITDLQRAVADLQKQMKAANDNVEPRAKAFRQ